MAHRPPQRCSATPLAFIFLLTPSGVTCNDALRLARALAHRSGLETGSADPKLTMTMKIVFSTTGSDDEFGPGWWIDMRFVDANHLEPRVLSYNNGGWWELMIDEEAKRSSFQRI